jgi:hypothetical protein
MVGARRSHEGNDKCIKVLDRKLVGKRPSEKEPRLAWEGTIRGILNT